MGNQTSPMEFVLSDFSEKPSLRILNCVLFLIIYITATFGNILIIFIIRYVPHLWTPMYFFIANLGILDMCCTSVIVPNLLINCLRKRKTISFGGCVVQLFMFIDLASTESTLLSVMAYDRYVAICSPLHYHVVMNKRVCVQLAIISWTNGVVVSLFHTVSTFILDFCQTNVIDHFFCDITPLLQIACSDTQLNENIIFGVGSIFVLPCLPLIIISYIYIIRSILRISSATGRSKTFSTCVSHLMTVSLFYFTGIAVYLRPVSPSSERNDKVTAVFYSVLVPMANPFIYSLRNNELKRAIRNTVIMK